MSVVSHTQVPSEFLLFFERISERNERTSFQPQKLYVTIDTYYENNVSWPNRTKSGINWFYFKMLNLWILGLTWLHHFLYASLLIRNTPYSVLRITEFLDFVHSPNF
jgi:hypothetical protein